MYLVDLRNVFAGINGYFDLHYVFHRSRDRLFAFISARKKRTSVR
ncbi:protein of unknown function (plasmid) [Pararobbsia alpina]